MFFKAACAFLMMAVGVCSLSPSGAQAQSYKITSVEVEGNKSIEASLILSVSGLSSGMTLSSTAVQEAIKRVYALSLFSDVHVDNEFAGGGMKVKIVVREYPKLKSLRIEGNKKIKRDEIIKKLTIAENQVIAPYQIRESIEAIKHLYREEGYHQAEVKQEVKELSETEMELTFEIKEQEKVKIRAIEFEGNVAFDDGKLRGKMSNKPDGFFRSGNFNQGKFEEDKDKIVELYHQKGYLDAALTDDSIAIDPDGKRIIIYIKVFEGLRYYFGDVRFFGNGLYSSTELSRQLKFKAGDVFNSEKYEQSIQNIYSLYYDRGYIHVKVLDRQQTTDSLLRVDMEISEGLPAHINKVLIVGNNKTKEKVIRRELFSRPGQMFSREVLMRSVRNAMVLNYFSKVEPDLKQLPNGDVDLVFKIEEKPTGQIQAGAGYSGQDKLVGTVTLGIPNFRGNGQNVSLEWSFGSRRNSISLSFTEPWFLDTPTSLGIDLFSLNRQYEFSGEEFTEGNRGAGIRLGRRLSWPDDYFKVYWRYRLEDVRYYDFNDYYLGVHASDAYALTRYNSEWLRTSATSLTLTRDSRDLSQFATSGSVVSLTSEYSGGILGGSWLYHKHIFEASKFTRVWWKFVLVSKLRLGVVDSPKGDDKIPYSERFAPGGTFGDGLIRGYDDGTVTPINPNGALIRGRSVLIYNLELQFPIAEQSVYGLLFADAGNSWLTGRAIKPFDLDRYDGLRKSIGAGFRVVVPGIGTIGFDFAYGYNNPDGAGWKPHFQIGSTF